MKPIRYEMKTVSCKQKANPIWNQSDMKWKRYRVNGALISGYYSYSGKKTGGPPKDSLLGPLLLLIYINDLPNVPKAPFTLPCFHMKTEKNFSVFALRSHCSSPLWKRGFSKTLMKTHEFENGAFWKRSIFSVNAKNGDIWLRYTFLC